MPDNRTDSDQSRLRCRRPFMQFMRARLVLLLLVAGVLLGGIFLSCIYSGGWNPDRVDSPSPVADSTNSPSSSKGSGSGKPPSSQPAEHQTNAVLESYLSPDRDQWQQTGRILTTMGLRSGQVIADIGSGSGYFSWHFSRVVGPQGRVLAVDVDPQAISFLKRRIQRDPPPYSNIQVIASREDDVCLPPASIDWAFLCEAHFFVEPINPNAGPCLDSLYRALRPQGRLAVIEGRYDPRRGRVDSNRLAAPFIRAGFTKVGQYEFLDKEHFVIFSRPQIKR